MNATREQQWAMCLELLDVKEATLLQEREHQRVYADENLIYKVRLYDAAEQAARGGDLRHEFDILSSCRKMRGVPQPVRFDECEHGCCAVYERIAGSPLATNEEPQPRLRGRRLWSAVVRTGLIVTRLSFRRIVHNDLRMKNILVDDHGQVYLIDFDMALRTSRMRAMYHNLLRIRSRKGRFGASFPHLVAWALAPSVPKRIGMALARRAGYSPTIWPREGADPQSPPGPVNRPPQ